MPALGLSAGRCCRGTGVLSCPNTCTRPARALHGPFSIRHPLTPCQTVLVVLRHAHPSTYAKWSQRRSLSLSLSVQLTVVSVACPATCCPHAATCRVALVLERTNSVELRPSLQEVYEATRKVCEDLMAVVGDLPRLVRQGTARQLRELEVSGWGCCSTGLLDCYTCSMISNCVCCR